MFAPAQQARKVKGADFGYFAGAFSNGNVVSTWTTRRSSTREQKAVLLAQSGVIRPENRFPVEDVRPRADVGVSSTRDRAYNQTQIPLTYKLFEMRHHTHNVSCIGGMRGFNMFEEK